MKKTFVIISLLIGVCGVVAWAYTVFPKEYRVSTSYIRMGLGGETLKLEIANTDALREQGLSGRKTMGSTEGMLFDFPQDGYHSFWMKDMLLPVDIIWFDAENRIVDVRERVQPSSYPEIFAPRVPARYVVELPEGFFEKHALKIGNILEILK